jgi:hypothetical protein
MSSPAKIIIDADNGKVDAANKKTQEGFKKSANEAAKVGSQIDKWGRQLGDKIAGIGAIIGVMRSVGQEAERQRSQAAGANRAVGGGALGRSQAVRDLGLDKTAMGAAGVDSMITGGAGGTSIEQRDAFLAALASQQRGGKTKMGADDSMRAMSLFNTGLFSQEELLAAAGKGGRGLNPLFGQVGQRFNAMSPEAREELGFREQERITSNQINELTAGRGRRARLADGQEDLFVAQNPLLGGLRNVVRNNSGGAMDLLESQAVVGENGSAMLRQQTEILGRIAENTKPKVSPTMATTPESGP